MLRWLLPALAIAGAAPAASPERHMLEKAEAAAYSAVGRLNIAGRRFCTATLIAPDVVITAAHCLYHPRTRERVPLDEMRFVAGLRLGEAAAVGRPVRAVTRPDFAFDGMADAEGVRADLALLALDAPLPPEILPFAPAPIADDGPPPAIVSYARDRPHAPSREAPCPPVSVFTGIAALDCAVVDGASGAPLLQGEGADARLVGVVSAMGNVLGSGRQVTLAVLIDDDLDALLAELAQAPEE
jgi:hypothetical protein